MKKYIIIFLLLFSINSYSQTTEKFMKLQRVFSLDTSMLITRPTSTLPLVIFKQTVPAGKIWIIKNINYTTGGYTTFQNNEYPTRDLDLSIGVNDIPIVVQRSGSPTSTLIIESPTSWGGNGSHNSMFLFTSNPIIISGGKELRFYTKFYGIGIDSGKYRAHIYFSVEEYLVE